MGPEVAPRGRAGVQPTEDVSRDRAWNEDASGLEMAEKRELGDAPAFRQLEGWSLDEAQWPRRRDLKTFLEWFDVTAQSIVADLRHDAVEVEDTDF